MMADDDENSKPNCLNADKGKDDIVSTAAADVTKEPSDRDEKSKVQEKPVEKEKEAEETKPSSSMVGGWFSSLVATAKQTVNKTTMESIKRDLDEFRTAVRNDTTMNMVYSTASSLVKQTFEEIGNSVTEIGSLGTTAADDSSVSDKNDDSLADRTKKDERLVAEEDDRIGDEEETSTASSDFDQVKTALGQWTNRLTDTAKTTMSRMKETLVGANSSLFSSATGMHPFPVDELDEEPFVVKDGDVIKIDNWKPLLHQLQIEPDTYRREPTGTDDDYDRWLVRFNLMNYQRQTEYLLETVPEIRQFHQELVPETLTETDFWHRYFYKVHQLKQKLASVAITDTAAQRPITTSTNQTEISRSSTAEDGWEKMSGSEVERQSTKSSDDDRDWVKCD